LVKRTSWGDDVARLLGFLVADSEEYELLSQNVMTDKQLLEMLDYLVVQLKETTPVSPLLLRPFLLLSHDHNLDVATKALTILTHHQEIEMFVESFIRALEQKLVSDEAFRIFTKLAIESRKFLQCFLRPGCSIPFHLAQL
jgi:hypothetical protein